MSIAFQAIAIRSPRRLRLVFSNTLAAGAFSTSWYSFSSLDSLGAAPTAVETLLVPNAPNEVELHVDIDLVGGAAYQLAVAAGVPAADATTAPAATYQFRPPNPRQAVSATLSADDIAELVYGVDIVWDGNDFVEGPDHDLTTISGPDNVKGAALRTVVADGLPYDASYGAHLREMVDSPIPYAEAARSSAARALKRDPRITDAQVTRIEDQNDGDVTLEGSIRLIGNTTTSLST